MDFFYELSLSIYDKGKSFGPDVLKLLEAIDKTGSLRRGCEEAGIDYGKGRQAIKRAESGMGHSLIVTAKEGKRAGGSRLTEEASELLKKCNGFLSDTKASAAEIFDSYFSSEQKHTAFKGTAKPYPTEQEINLMYELYGTSKKHIVHMKRVANLAEKKARELVKKGYPLDVRLIKCAALLHDVARPGGDHAKTGASWLLGLGYGRISELVRAHDDIDESLADQISEMTVLYWADAQFKGGKRIGHEEKIERLIKKYKDEPEKKKAFIEKHAVISRIDKLFSSL